MRRMYEEWLPLKFLKWCPAWKKKKGNIWKFEGAGSNTWNGRKRGDLTALNGSKERIENKNKNKTLGPGKCENVDTLYINKNKNYYC